MDSRLPEDRALGLFDFEQNAGQLLFGRDEEAAESIKAHIEANNPGIKNLNITFTDGLVKVSGDPESQAALEKAVLMAGNVRGVDEVRVTSAQPLEQIGDVEFYVIQSGDTLSGIAQTFYGEALDFTGLFAANREVIKNPDKIYVGQKIRIPLKRPDTYD